jgi:endonuclease YncB( thermonuclease family)
MLTLDSRVARSASTNWTGTVLTVMAGDTLKILHGKLARVVRLSGVDAPRMGQPWGEDARRFVQGLAQGRTVTVEPRGRKAGRQLLGNVILPDGRDLGMELLKEGLAWHDKRRSADAFLGELETNARKDRLGLWADAHPVPPWRWRPRGR